MHKPALDSSRSGRPALGDWEDGPVRDPRWFDVEPSAAQTAVVGEHELCIELLSVGAAAVGVRLARDPGDRYRGFGIRSDELERTAGVVEN